MSRPGEGRTRREVLIALLLGPLRARAKEPMEPSNDDAKVLADAIRLASTSPVHASKRIERHTFAADLEPVATLLRGELLAKQGEFRSAIALYHDAAKRHPREGAFALREAVLLLRQGDPVAAERLLRRSFEAAPLPEAALHLAEALAARGRRADATPWWVRTAVLEGDSGRWRALAEQKLAALPDFGAGPMEAELLAQALRLRARSAVVDALAVLRGRAFRAEWDVFACLLEGQLLDQLDDPAAAEAFRRGLKTQPEDPHLHLRLAAFTWRRGDAELARRLLRRSWAAAHLPETAWRQGEIEAARASEDDARERFVWAVALEGEGGHWRDLATERIAK